MQKSVRDNPPSSITSFEMINTYRTLYDDITENGTTINFVDRHALGELTITLCEMNQLRECLREQGEAVERMGDRNMITKKNPAREALQRMYPLMMKLFSEFNMTPKSRGKNFSGKGENANTKGDDFGDV